MMSTPAKNRLSQMLSKLELLPAPLRTRARSLLLGRVVPFAGRAGIVVREMSSERVVVHIPNARPAQNHIRGVHACAMALAAESATGYVVGMTVPDSAIPLVKSLKLDYVRRCKGGITATATLSPEDVQRIRTEAKGSVTVPVSLVDDAGGEPVVCEAVWAWVPKKA
jgi:acyl-coenzyme A thioesterase PaaI-like protein